MHFVLLYCLQINFMFMIYVLCQRCVFIPGVCPKMLENIIQFYTILCILLDTFDNNLLSVIGGRRANHAAASVSLFTWRREGLEDTPRSLMLIWMSFAVIWLLKCYINSFLQNDSQDIFYSFTVSVIKNRVTKWYCLLILQHITL